LDLSSVVHEDARWRLRRAEASDNDALLRLFRDVRMRGALELAQERDPSFFALLDLHAAPYDTWIAENDALGVASAGSIVVHPAHVLGQVRQVGYTADLRALPAFARMRAVPTAYRVAMREAERRHGAELFYTTVLGSNRVWLNAIARSERRAEMPLHRLICRFHMTAVQFTFKNKRRASVNVARATHSDADALLAFLSASARERMFGYVVNEALFAQRLKRWPGFSISSFFIARDRQGNIVGCLAPWDSTPVKRSRIIQYDTRLSRLKLIYDAAARVFGFVPLPNPGELFRYSYLTHLEIADDNPLVLRDLLRAAYAELRPRDLHFMAAMIPRGSPLAKAFGDFFVDRTEFNLYAVVEKASPLANTDFTSLRPGFEMALN